MSGRFDDDHDEIGEWQDYTDDPLLALWTAARQRRRQGLTATIVEALQRRRPQ